MKLSHDMKKDNERSCKEISIKSILNKQLHIKIPKSILPPSTRRPNIMKTY